MSHQFNRHILFPVILLSCFFSGSGFAASICKNTDLTLQVLGSGGPIADDERASSAYLVWHQAKSRYLIDAGGGAFLRFAEAKGNIEDLDAIAISHFHADHSADLPAILKSGYFSERKSPLLVSGPSARPPFPNTNQFLDAILDKKHGAFAYLSGYLNGSDGLFELEQEVIDTSKKTESLIQQTDNARLFALGVPHGPVPALAYRLEIDGKRMVFSSDQNGSNPEFTRFTRDADILIFHMAIPEDSNDSRLHAKPSQIGKIAAEAGVKTLVLSHFMQRSLKELKKNVSLVRQHFKGEIITAKDLQCFPLNS